MIFKNAKSLIFTLGIILSFSKIFAQDRCPIIPLPQEAKRGAGEFKLDQSVLIVYKDKRLTPLASALQQQLLKFSSLPLTIHDKSTSKAHQIILDYDKDSGNEGYKLKIQPDKIILSANSDHGIYNGINSLLQIVISHHVLDRKGKFTGRIRNLICWEIKDWPKYAWRGVMLDEARHFFGTEKVKTLIDWMSFYKLNRLHWHLTDAQGWRIEIKKYPKLALIGGIGNARNPTASAKYYTQDEIREVIAYAAARFITIVPEIDMPGHASAATRAYPELHGGGSGFTFNPGKEHTYTFLSQVLREVDALFPSQMIHLGGDEVSHGSKTWNELPDVKTLMKEKKLDDLKAVEHYFFKRMADSVMSFNNKVLGWDEATEAKLPVDKTILFWWRDGKILEKAVAQGYSLVLCPKRPFYFDFSQDSTHKYGNYEGRSTNTSESVYNFSLDRLPVKVKSANILGIQANVWTERITTEQRLQFMIFPRMLALAETAWTNNEMKDYVSFKNRVKEHNKLFRLNNIYFYDLDETAKNGEPIN
ncbi:MAG TPA: beta-N-acetylhexosaminidase [Sphingobacteriaceae bacterium]